MFLGSYPLELGAITPVFYAFTEREQLQAVMEEISGGRMHYMFNRVGGLKEDMPAGWTDRVGEAVAAVRTGMRRLEGLLLGNEIVRARTVGVGVLTPAAGARLRRERTDRAGERCRPRPSSRRAVPGVRRAVRRQAARAAW